MHVTFPEHVGLTEVSKSVEHEVLSLVSYPKFLLVCFHMLIVGATLIVFVIHVLVICCLLVLLVT